MLNSLGSVATQKGWTRHYHQHMVRTRPGDAMPLNDQDREVLEELAKAERQYEEYLDLSGLTKPLEDLPVEEPEPPQIGLPLTLSVRTQH